MRYDDDNGVVVYVGHEAAVHRSSFAPRNRSSPSAVWLLALASLIGHVGVVRRRVASRWMPGSDGDDNRSGRARAPLFFVPSVNEIGYQSVFGIPSSRPCEPFSAVFYRRCVCVCISMLACLNASAWTLVLGAMDRMPIHVYMCPDSPKREL